jgi:hypothetical protein
MIGDLHNRGQLSDPSVLLRRARQVIDRLSVLHVPHDERRRLHVTGADTLAQLKQRHNHLDVAGRLLASDLRAALEK